MRKAQKLNSGINLLFYFFFSLLSRPYWIYNEWMTGIDYFSFLCTKPIGPVGLNEKKFHLPNVFNRKGVLNILLYIEISAVNWKGANRRDRKEKMLNTKNKIPKNSMESNPELDTGSGADNFQWSGKRFDTVPTTQRGVQEETSRISINSLSYFPSISPYPSLFSLSICIECSI